MTHYVCTGGCNGISDQLGNCQMKDCPKFGQPLLACDCEDGKHEAVFQKIGEDN